MTALEFPIRTESGDGLPSAACWASTVVATVLAGMPEVRLEINTDYERAAVYSVARPELFVWRDLSTLGQAGAADVLERGLSDGKTLLRWLRA